MVNVNHVTHLIRLSVTKMLAFSVEMINYQMEISSHPHLAVVLVMQLGTIVVKNANVIKHMNLTNRKQDVS